MLILRMTGAVCELNWKKLRTKFSRLIKDQPASGASATSDNSPKWPFFQQMLFFKSNIVGHKEK